MGGGSQLSSGNYLETVPRPFLDLSDEPWEVSSTSDDGQCPDQLLVHSSFHVLDSRPGTAGHANRRCNEPFPSRTSPSPRCTTSRWSLYVTKQVCISHGDSQPREPGLGEHLRKWEPACENKHVLYLCPLYR